eukprot:3443024-Rhodomonas_salina.2
MPSGDAFLRLHSGLSKNVNLIMIDAEVLGTAKRSPVTEWPRRSCQWPGPGFVRLGVSHTVTVTVTVQDPAGSS